MRRTTLRCNNERTALQHLNYCLQTRLQFSLVVHSVGELSSKPDTLVYGVCQLIRTRYELEDIKEFV